MKEIRSWFGCFSEEEMEIKIRKAKEGDLPQILKLYSQLDMDDGKPLPLENAKKLFNKLQKYPEYKIFVGIYENKIIGTFSLLIMDNLVHGGTPSGIVEAVVVDPEYHGVGIGKQMMRFAMERCREFGCYKLVLSANMMRDKAHRFYESLGFDRHGYSFLIHL
jgi:GNAT superfamily N-acetyltransferase